MNISKVYILKGGEYFAILQMTFFQKLLEASLGKF